MLETVSKILYVVSTSALVPVILALLGLAAYTLLMLGGLLSELWSRLASRRWIADRMRCLREGRADVATGPSGGSVRLPSSGFVPRYLRAACAGTSVASAEIDEIELEMAQAVASLSAIARLGPMLGLAGTLIPLGPGLMSLAQGEVAGLAGQLVIAFSTTVVGLLIGMVAYACAQVRRSWYARDLSGILHAEETRCEKWRPTE